MSTIPASDKEFLDRMDKAWVAVFALATLLLSPVLQELLYGKYGLGLVSVFLFLAGCTVLPFVVEVWGITSDSARPRLLSWVMLATAVVVTALQLLYVFFVRTRVLPLVVPSIMGRGEFGFICGWYQGLVTMIVVRDHAGRHLIRHFRANLRTHPYQDQLPSPKAYKDELLLIILGYWAFAFVAGILLALA